MHLQIIFFDHQSRPDQIEQLVLAHHPITVLDQHEQQVERARAKPGWLAIDEHLTRFPQDGAVVEDEIGSDGRIGHCFFLGPVAHFTTPVLPNIQNN